MDTKNDKSFAYTLTTALAAAFNMLVLLVLCFGIMPAIQTGIEETRETQKAILHSHYILEENSRDLEEQGKVIRRLNDALDAAEKKMKAATPPKKE